MLRGRVCAFRLEYRFPGPYRLSQKIAGVLCRRLFIFYCWESISLINFF
ncbi:hypothetical protein HMPREF1987_00446 [Peptostreptococcaceae bacterium oral taxon 113 str. W5053]|nr:hypothetical protein HMPREF1987_00446 [Peptostreptococcaceae bacterium oral taxon 113 str. W5053]